MQTGYVPYEPQLVPRAVAENIWTVEGEEVGYRFAGTVLPCPTRMTVVRIGRAELWLHSPVRCSAALAGRLSALGEVVVIVAPNSFHHVHAADWAAAFPSARIFATPDLVASARPPFDRAEPLSDAIPLFWGDSLDTALLRLPSFVEAVFLHRPSRTLIVTDLMQNFEPGRVRGRLARLLLTLGGATGPTGTASIEIRIAAIGRRERVRALRQTILDWRPSRVIVSHGKCYEVDVEGELLRAFSWIGD